jgi:hypothetical protein
MITIYLVTWRIAEGPREPRFFFLHLGQACACAKRLAFEAYTNESLEVFEMVEKTELLPDQALPKFGQNGMRRRAKS